MIKKTIKKEKKNPLYTLFKKERVALINSIREFREGKNVLVVSSFPWIDTTSSHDYFEHDIENVCGTRLLDTVVKWKWKYPCQGKNLIFLSHVYLSLSGSPIRLETEFPLSNFVTIWSIFRSIGRISCFLGAKIR